MGLANASGEIAPTHLDRIEALDDTIFAALAGDARALDRSAELYHQTQRATPSELLDESREQYIRQAEAIVRRYREAPEETLPRAFAALEILTLLAE